VLSYHVAFWNLENLFDIDHSPLRPDWLQQNLARELMGWDAASWTARSTGWRASSAR
jgi:hypothetical protein